MSINVRVGALPESAEEKFDRIHNALFVDNPRKGTKADRKLFKAVSTLAHEITDTRGAFMFDTDGAMLPGWTEVIASAAPYLNDFLPDDLPVSVIIGFVEDLGGYYNGEDDDDEDEDEDESFAEACRVVEELKNGVASYFDSILQ